MQQSQDYFGWVKVQRASCSPVAACVTSLMLKMMDFSVRSLSETPSARLGAPSNAGDRRGKPARDRP